MHCACILCSQAVRRSKVYVWQAKQRSRQQQVDKSKQYCMFFNRFGETSCTMYKDFLCVYSERVLWAHVFFSCCALCILAGKCKHMDTTCPYIHDPDKIAVCTKLVVGSHATYVCMCCVEH